MFFRKKRQQPHYPSWLKWAALAFLVVTIIGNHKNPGSEPTALDAALQKTATDIESNKTISFSDIKSRIAAGYAPPLQWQDTTAGSGAAAVCGQTVSIAYQTYASDGKELADKADSGHPLQLAIGDGTAMPALEQGVAGMKPGGKRSITALPALAYGIDKFARKDMPTDAPVRFDVTLLSAEPALPDTKTAPLRITSRQDGQGAPITCGQTIKAHVTMWSMGGSQLYTSKDGPPLEITPGKGDLFLGLELGVIGMREHGATRTLIVPPAYQKTISGDDPNTDFSFPDAQTVLVDVETLP